MHRYRNAGKSRKNSDARRLISGAGWDAIDIFKYKLCAEELLAIAPVEPMIRRAAGSNFRSLIPAATKRPHSPCWSGSGATPLSSVRTNRKLSGRRDAAMRFRSTADRLCADPPSFRP